ncbi:hypothetical protein BN1708_019557, partial [Verticillium longisporum]
LHLPASGGPLPPADRPPHPLICPAAQEPPRAPTVGRRLGGVQRVLRCPHGHLPPGRHRSRPSLHEQAARRHKRHMVEDVLPADMAAERQERGPHDARCYGP